MKKIISLLLALIICLSLCACGSKAKEAQYTQALEHMTNDEYAQAITIFSELGEYKDCLEQLSIAKTNLQLKLQYEDACEKIKEKEYAQAAELLNGLNYSDSERLYEKCCKLLYQQKIIEAVDEFNKQYFSIAQGLFQDAAAYASDEQALETSRQYAKISEILTKVKNGPEESFALTGLQNFPLESSKINIVGEWSVRFLEGDRTRKTTFTSDHKYVDFFAINMGEYWSFKDGILQLDIWQNANFRYYKVHKASPEVLVLMNTEFSYTRPVAVMWKELEASVLLGDMIEAEIEFENWDAK